MKFLDCTYLHQAPIGLGLGLQPSLLISMHAGAVRDPLTHALLSNKPLLEPKLDTDVLFDALRAIPKGGWAIFDVEGADSYIARHDFAPAHNDTAFENWRVLLQSAKNIRPDIRIAANSIQWYSPDGANYGYKVNWSEIQRLDDIFRSKVNPLIDALSLEIYYQDWPSPPASKPGDVLFNMYGSQDLRFGFRDHVQALHEWARAISGKAPGHLFSIACESYSRPETVNHFLTGDQMSSCLNLIDMYDPVFVGLWGTASAEKTFTTPDGWKIGTFDPSAPWLAEVKKRIS